jgi:hypothetical protein
MDIGTAKPSPAERSHSSAAAASTSGLPPRAEPSDEARLRALAGRQQVVDCQSWLGEFGQGDRWRFCLTAAGMARAQERR